MDTPCGSRLAGGSKPLQVRKRVCGFKRGEGPTSAVWLSGAAVDADEYDESQPSAGQRRAGSWVAVKEFGLNYHNRDIWYIVALFGIWKIFTTSIGICIYIYVCMVNNWVFGTW